MSFTFSLLNRVNRLQAVFVLLIIAAVLPSSIVVTFSVWESIRVERALWDKELLNSAAEIAEDADLELRGQLDIVQVLTNSPLLDGEIDKEAIDEWFRRLMASHKHQWISIILSDTNGNILHRLGDDPGHPFTKLVDKESLHKAIDGQPVVGNLILGPLDRWAIPIRTPVVRDGKVTSVLSLVVYPSVFTAVMMTHRDLLPGMIATIADASGRIVTRSAGEATGRLLSERGLAARRDNEMGLYAGRTIDGDDTVAAFRTTRHGGWSAHISMPVSAYNARLDQFKLSATGAGIGSLIITAIFLVVLYREIQRRQQEVVLFERKLRMESLGHLTGRVAHDFNNLLTVISAHLEMVEAKDPDSRSLQAMRRSVEKATKMTSKLLAFSRGASDRPEHVSINTRLFELIQDMRKALPENITVDLELAPGLPEIELDPVQLDVAVLNMVINSCDAMPDGGVITISTENSFVEGRWVCLNIKDTGTGIPRHIVGRVFDPFFTTKKSKGTGFGLSQVYGFVTASKGNVTVDSSTDGTTFHIRFPACAVPRQDNPNVQPLPLAACL